MMLELETDEGEVLTFKTQEEMMNYVISRMVEKNQLSVIGRDEQDDLVLKAIQ